MQGLEFFCAKFAPNLGMYFDADFWTQFVMQASVAEPAVRHAIVAVGVLAKQRELQHAASDGRTPVLVTDVRSLATIAISPEGQSLDADSILAIRNYNMSINHLAQHMAASSALTDITLLACVLFVCVEFLRGDEEASRRHFRGGMAILMNSMSSSGGTNTSMVRPTPMRHVMSPMFNRMEMLSTLFGNEPTWRYPVALADTVPATFQSLGHARNSITHLMNLSLRFIRSVYLSKYEPSSTSPSATSQQAALLHHLALWEERLSTYRTSHTSELTSIDMYACNVLGIGHIVAKIWVSTALTPFECAHDAHMLDFEAAIELAEQLPAIASMHDQSDRYTTAFTLDVEVLGPMHWVSIKCRDPTLRRRALAVQLGTRRREGLWDSQVYAALAERMIAVEEEGLKDGELPSEEARVHHSIIEKMADAGSSDHLITLHSRPNGVYEEMRVTQERIHLFA